MNNTKEQLPRKVPVLEWMIWFMGGMAIGVLLTLILI